jgi:hypothetical protein
MDAKTLLSYRDEIAYLMREEFGRKSDLPVSYTAGRALIASIADLLETDEYTAFLQAALRGDQGNREPGGPLTWSFNEYFGRALRDTIGEAEEEEGRQAAWHIMLALHSVLSRDAFYPFVRCMYDAWCATVDVPQQLAAAV